MSTAALDTERAIAGILARRDLADRLAGQIAEQVAAAINADAAELYLTLGVRASLDRLVNRTCDLVTAEVRLVRRPHLRSAGPSHPGQGDVAGWSVYASVRLTDLHDHADHDLCLVAVGNVVDLEG